MAPRVALMRPAVAAFGLSLVVLWVLLTQCLAPFYLAGPPPGAPEAAFRRVLDRQVPGILRHYRVPGMAIGTVVHGDPGVIYTYGLADVEHHRRVAPDTVFQVASLSKSVTAWGVLALWDAGKVGLDAPAESYLDPWPLAPSPYPSCGVTLRRLLSHTAGLNAGEDEFRRPDDPRVGSLELLAREGPAENGHATPARLTSPPGKDFVYSAPGYTLVQLIIERRTGVPFESYMKTAVLRPLRMNRSSFTWDPELRPRTATPYLADGRPSPVLAPQDAAADSLFSTVGDLMRFVAAPIPGQGLPVGAGVISSRAAAQLFRPPAAFPKRGAFAIGPEAPCMGCYIEHGVGGPTFVTNIGHDPGWTSQIDVAPDTGDGLVVLTNSSRGQAAIAQVAALWSSWRGLPAPQLTRSYRTLGLAAVVVVTVISGLAIAAAFTCLNETLSGVRRWGAFSRPAGFRSLVEWAAAGALVWAWVSMSEVFEMLPVFALVAKSALAGLVAAVSFRSLFPARATRPARRAGPPAATGGADLNPRPAVRPPSGAIPAGADGPRPSPPSP